MSAIEHVAAHRLDVPMRKAFGISGGAQKIAANVLVELTTSGGVTGFGEGAPFPAFNGETQGIALAACERAASLLQGIDVEDTDAIRRVVAGACAGSPSAKCALETAVVDAQARARGVSLVTLFGGAERTLRTDVTITTGSVEDAEREAREFSAFDVLKIKIGGGPLARDVGRLRAIRAARPDARLLVDANAGLSPAAAIAFAEAALREGVAIELFEQPIPPGDWDALAEVRRRTGLPIAIDESVTSAADVDEAKRRGAADAVNVKIMKSGIFEALAIIERAAALGLRRMIGGMVETRLAMGTSACIAAGIGGFSYIDLDTPLFLSDDPFVGGYVQDGPLLDLAPVDLGHGLRPR